MENLILRKIGNKYLAIDPETTFWMMLEDKKEFEDIEYDDEMKTQLQDRLEKISNDVFLSLAEIHLTEACNMRCSYCYVPQTNREQLDTMSKDQVDNLMSLLGEYADQKEKSITICFHGGEPFMARELLFKAIEEYSKDKRFNLLLQTNGTLVYEDSIEFLRNHEVNIGISVDGYGDLHNANRVYPNGKGTFDKVSQVLELLRDYDHLGALTTITCHTVDYLPEIINYFYTLNIPSVVFNPVSPENEMAEKVFPDMNTLISKYRKAIDFVLDRNMQGKENLIIDNAEALLLCILSDVRSVFCHMSPCGAGRLNLIFTSNGDVYPCSGFAAYKEFRAGNIFEHTIDQLFESSACKMCRQRTVDTIPECAACEYKHICCSCCPIPSYHLHGSLHVKSPFCEFYHAIIDHLFGILGEDIRRGLALVQKKYYSMFSDEDYYYKTGVDTPPNRG